ncbi:hypothetical protein CLU79DRAFT_836265 [Phycomyces nitens]|nr:hypothetical protein CLU79DRAFT_836265 [Phycomyces nitens]
MRYNYYKPESQVMLLSEALFTLVHFIHLFRILEPPTTFRLGAMYKHRPLACDGGCKLLLRYALQRQVICSSLGVEFTGVNCTIGNHSWFEVAPLATTAYLVSAACSVSPVSPDSPAPGTRKACFVADFAWVALLVMVREGLEVDIEAIQLQLDAIM